MFAPERQRRILDDLKREGRATVTELAQRYGVSEHTIRRDLHHLEQHGQLRKTHGGAVALDTAHLNFHDRTHSVPHAKDRIGRAAASLIQPGQTLVIDAGSTTLAFARHLTHRPLTIITNSLDIAREFDSDTNVHLIVTGGTWNAASRAFHGAAAQLVLSRYRADWTILGTCALHPTAGATVTHDSDATMKQAMIDAAQRTMILADHTKRERVVAHVVIPATKLHTVVTDEPWPALHHLGVTVVTPTDEPTEHAAHP